MKANPAAAWSAVAKATVSRSIPPFPERYVEAPRYAVRSRSTCAERRTRLCRVRDTNQLLQGGPPRSGRPQRASTSFDRALEPVDERADDRSIERVGIDQDGGPRG